MSPNASAPSQLAFLHDYLRGTGRAITSKQARELFGIQRLPARMYELKQAGLRIRKAKNENGQVRYSVSARDINGSRSSLVG